MLTKRKKFQRKITRSFDDLKRDPNIHKRFTIKFIERRRIGIANRFPSHWSRETKEKVFRKARSNAFFVEEGREEGYIVEMHLSIPPVVEDGPGRSRVSSFPRGGQLFKRGRREGEAEKSKGETDRKRGEAVGSGIGEARGGRGQKAKREVFWLAAKNRRERLSTAGRSVRVCERKDRKEEREGGEGRGKEKKRGKKKRKERKKRRKKKTKKKKEKEKGAHTTTRWVSTRRMRAIPWRSYTAILSSDPSSPRFPSHLLIPAESFSCSPLFSSFLPGSNDVIY